MKNDKKTIFGWCMYDWANSAYITTAAVALLPDYFARAVVGEDGINLFGMNVTATTLWGYMLGTAAFLVFLFAPVLGAVADFSSAKKRFLIGFAYIGSLFATMLFFSKSGDVGLTVFLFLGSQICFVGANVFYDAFLPQIASEDKLDSVSARGYAFGYVGGSLQFGTALALVAMHETVGISLQCRSEWLDEDGGSWGLLTLNPKEKKKANGLQKFRIDPSYSMTFYSGISRIFTQKVALNNRHLYRPILQCGINLLASMATIYCP